MGDADGTKPSESLALWDPSEDSALRETLEALEREEVPVLERPEVSDQVPRFFDSAQNAVVAPSQARISPQPKPAPAPAALAPSPVAAVPGNAHVWSSALPSAGPGVPAAGASNATMIGQPVAGLAAALPAVVKAPVAVQPQPPKASVAAALRPATPGAAPSSAAVAPVSSAAQSEAVDDTGRTEAQRRAADLLASSRRAAAAQRAAAAEVAAARQAATAGSRSRTTSFDRLLTRYIGIAFERQLAMREYLGDAPWQLDLAAGTVSFGDKGTFPIQLLGSVSETKQTWLWAWANQSPGIGKSMTHHSRALKKEVDLPEFQEAVLPLSQTSGEAIALTISGMAGGVPFYRGPFPGGAVYFLVSDVPLSSAPDITKLPAALMAVIEAFPQANCREMVEGLFKDASLATSSSGNEIVGSRITKEVVVTFDVEGRVARVNVRPTNSDLATRAPSPITGSPIALLKLEKRTNNGDPAAVPPLRPGATDERPPVPSATPDPPPMVSASAPGTSAPASELALQPLAAAVPPSPPSSVAAAPAPALRVGEPPPIGGSASSALTSPASPDASPSGLGTQVGASVAVPAATPGLGAGTSPTGSGLGANAPAMPAVPGAAPTASASGLAMAGAPLAPAAPGLAAEPAASAVDGPAELAGLAGPIVPGAPALPMGETMIGAVGAPSVQAGAASLAGAQPAAATQEAAPNPAHVIAQATPGPMRTAFGTGVHQAVELDRGATVVAGHIWDTLPSVEAPPASPSAVQQAEPAQPQQLPAAQLAQPAPMSGGAPATILHSAIPARPLQGMESRLAPAPADASEPARPAGPQSPIQAAVRAPAAYPTPSRSGSSSAHVVRPRASGSTARRVSVQAPERDLTKAYTVGIVLVALALLAVLIFGMSGDRAKASFSTVSLEHDAGHNAALTYEFSFERLPENPDSLVIRLESDAFSAPMIVPWNSVSPDPPRSAESYVHQISIDGSLRDQVTESEATVTVSVESGGRSAGRERVDIRDLYNFGP